MSYRNDNQKGGSILTCEPCQYTTTSSSNFRRHVGNAKHVRAIMVRDAVDTENTTPQLYTCICGKSYTHRGSLYNHHLNCMNRTTQFSVVSKITNDCCDSLQCCDADKEIVHGLVAEYVSDTKKHVSAQIRRYLKRRDKITDPEVKRVQQAWHRQVRIL